MKPRKNIKINQNGRNMLKLARGLHETKNKYKGWPISSRAKRYYMKNEFQKKFIKELNNLGK